MYDIKDGDALVGQCTYHNDENRYVYAGSTHTDEMCNVYLMYYTENADDVMEVCAGNTYPQLEDVIPAVAQQRPPPPASFNTQNGGSQSEGTNPMSHHDMEGSKIHPTNDNTKKQPLPGQNSLAYLLGQSGLGANVAAGAGTDDYYDQIEQSRGRSRQKDLLDLQSQDDLQNFFDQGPLVDLDNGNDDYSSLLSPSDSASQLLLAAELTKLKKKNNFGDSVNKANKIKTQLNNLTPQTVSST